MTAPPLVKPLDEEDEGIDMAQYSQQKKAADKVEEYDETVDMAEYAKSQEAKDATLIDHLREAGEQTIAGIGQAFSYPLDFLKLAMLGEGLTDIDELEEAFEKAGKPFDRNKYIKTVMEQAEFAPTQELLERTIDKNIGSTFAEPKTATGKAFNKFFFLTGLARGKGLGKATKSAAVGTATTAALRAAGAPDIVSELTGDVTSGIASIEKEARKFTHEQQRIIDIAEKQGLPLMEFMLEDTTASSAKISKKRKAAFEKELGMSTDKAIEMIKEDKIPITKLRNQGYDLEVLEDEAFQKATQAAATHKTPIDITETLNDIDREIARIKSLAPSPSAAQEAAIRVLQEEKAKLSAPSSTGTQLLNAQGNPIGGAAKAQGKLSTATEVVQQTRNYNSNVKGIYKKAEFSGVEDEVKNAYGFLNESLRKRIETQAPKEVIDSHRAYNTIFGQNAALARTEGLLAKAFPDGKYSAKDLNRVLNSKQGNILRRDLGEDGIKELRQIAEYGKRAQDATTQFVNSSKHKFKASEWGPLAGFLLAKMPVVGGAVVAGKPMLDYVRGYVLTRPVARKAYANITKNAANGSFKNMAKDFKIIEDEIIKEYGSIDDFMKQGIHELELYKEGEEG